MDDLLAEFLTETGESLAELDLALVRLERSPGDAETLSLIFRLVHTIKGTCGFLGLPRLEAVAHAAENVLVKLRDQIIPATPGTVGQVIAAVDCIRAIVAGLAANGQEPQGEDAGLIAKLDAFAAGEAVVDPLAGGATAAEPAIDAGPEGNDPAAPGHGGAPTHTIRVAVGVLEDLMTLVGELVLTRNQLLQIARSQGDNAYAVPLQRLSQITSDLQDGVMKTRMQPIGNAWNKLPRLVRDLSHELGKKLDLVLLGAETELDRQVLEQIRDPLTHMVRNAADHGLETPDERRAAGKPDTGRITLNAYHEGGHIILEVGDDGRGLPVERIRAKAVAQGLASEPEMAAMTDAQALQFIFRAGFSTAASVTAVSGRGVGMDVVRTNIERIGGTVELHSTPGRGTVFTIKIPLTLAIVSALIVEAGGERLAIPQISVVELVRAAAPGDRDEAGAAHRIETVGGAPVLRLRDRLLPLLRLGALLGLEPGQDATGKDGAAEDGAATIIVTQAGGTILGIVVDRVFDTEEIVVKPVAPILRHLSAFSGTTILGDGAVIMILDPNGLARASHVRANGGPDAAAATGATDGEHVDLLLFRAGGAELNAVPLRLVARIEDLPAEAVEVSAGQVVTQYRGRLMPLVPFAGAIDPARPRHKVLVFNDVDIAAGRDRSMGLVVDEIVDVVRDQIRVELSRDTAGVMGTAVIAGRATAMIDTGFWLTKAFGNWFGGPARRGGAARRPRILVVEDSDFFRQMLVPALEMAGYAVTATGSARQALEWRDSGRVFEAIVSDVEMPDIDGLTFVRAIREAADAGSAASAWASLPVIALSGRSHPTDIAAGRAAGFTDYVAKFDRDSLLASLQSCLSSEGGEADPPLAFPAPRPTAMAA